MIVRHFAWFSRADGGWLGERKSLVPEPAIDPALVGNARLAAVNAWQQEIVGMLDALPILDEQWDVERWNACLKHGAVCLDVTRFQWPVGDHVWHRWDEAARFLDWPESSGHKFIEIDLTTLCVIANQASHRPIRSTMRRAIVDITGTSLEPFWGSIWGRFVRGIDGWGFEVHSASAITRPTVRLLETAAAELHPDTFVAVKEGVLV